MAQRTSFSFQVEGVQSASRTFFGKSAEDLSLAEMLSLAVIPRRPELYNPLVSPENAVSGAKRLAQSLGIDIKGEELEADIFSAAFHPAEDRAPHFSRLVRSKEPGARFVRASLDLDLNSFLKERLSYYLEMNSQSRLTNGAAILIDVKTEILAYLGSRIFTTLKFG